MRGLWTAKYILQQVTSLWSATTNCSMQNSLIQRASQSSKSIATNLGPFMHAHGAKPVLSNRRTAPSLTASAATVSAWPAFSVNLQRKVQVWSRCYNAEELVTAQSAYASTPPKPQDAGRVLVHPSPAADADSISHFVSDDGSAAAEHCENGSAVQAGSHQHVESMSNGNGKPIADASALPSAESAQTVADDVSSSLDDRQAAAPSFTQATGAAAAVPNAAAPAQAAASAAAEEQQPSNSDDSGSTSADESPVASSSDASSSIATASSDAAQTNSSSSEAESSAPTCKGYHGPATWLVMQSGAAMLPHPDKAHKGGEDSFFIADHQAAIGVADGVGGWAEIGVDAGAYARLLMVNAKEAAEAAANDLAAGALSSQKILESAFYCTNVQGSSTACVIVLNGKMLSASNLGDSGFVLVRNGQPKFQCPQQQHNFNFPFQLGSADSMSDQPQAAMRFDLELEPGDIIVTGSDGLWDNIFAEEAATIATKCREKGETATTAAQVLCRYARMRASDAKYHSPFSYAAIQAGYVYLGGKMDDITVLVSFVTLPSAKL